MCDECTVAGAGGVRRFLLSRRSFLVLGASVGGGLAAMWGGCEGPGGEGNKKVAATIAASAVASRRVAGTTAPASTRAVASAPETVPATPTTTQALAGAPDLGSELFPDASGRAIALATDAPVIVLPRTDWTTARPDLSHIAIMNGIERVTVHHTAGEMETDNWEPTADELERIREFHTGNLPTDRQWADIAYHFVVDRAGRVWQARPLAYQGAHVKGHNEHNLGIVLLGDFEVQTPSAAQLWSLAGFIGFVRQLYRVPLDQVFTHGELGETSCPGKNLQAYMMRTRKAWGAAEGVPWESARVLSG